MYDILAEDVMQLGHDGGACPIPESKTSSLIVVDMSGIRRLKLRYCACGTTNRFRQLLRARMYPSTIRQPRSAWSFSFLDTYIRFSVQGKLSLYDFYMSVIHWSHATATSDKLVNNEFVPSDIFAYFLTACALELFGFGITSIHPSEDVEACGTGT
jgi:hypothetical protein